MRTGTAYVEDGSDPFGMNTRPMPWNNSTDSVQRAKDKMDAAFEFITKLGVPYYCFHDVDLIDEGDTISEYEKSVGTDHRLCKRKAIAYRSEVTLGDGELVSLIQDI